MALELRKVEAIDLSQRTEWYALVRLIFLLALAVPGLLSLLVIQGWDQISQSTTLIAALAAFTNLVFYILVRAHRNQTYHAVLAMIMIAIDIALITFFIFTTGGIESRSPILYTVPVLIAASLFGRQGIYMASLTSTVVYVGIIVSDYFGFIHSTGAFDPTLRTDLGYVVNTISFFPVVFLVIALAVDFITGLLSEKQQQLRSSIETLERAQSTAKLGNWQWDVLTDHVVWSKELFAIYGIDTNNQYKGYEDMQKFIHQDDSAAHRKAIRQSLRKKVPFKSDYRIIRTDGTIKYLHSEGVPECGRDGEVLRLIGTTQDVTELYHLDIAKREFVSLASHQLRTPASGVKAFLSLLVDGHAGELTRKQLSFARKAYESNDRQLAIIDSLLSLASIESGRLSIQPEKLELASFVRSCIEPHKLSIKSRSQKLKFDKRAGPVYVSADPNSLRMVIDNLISNANKYTPDGGSINVTVRANGQKAIIGVSDTGIGIAKKDLPALFQKFSRLSDPASKTVGGSGLGLYIARYIVELHKGKLLVKSKHGVGTTFIIKLPLTSQKEVN